MGCSSRTGDIVVVIVAAKLVSPFARSPTGQDLFSLDSDLVTDRALCASVSAESPLVLTKHQANQNRC